MIDRESFFIRVDKNGPLMAGMSTQCWLWTAGRSSKGYGRLKFRQKNLIASRVALAFHLGRELLPKMFACHHCDNPPCVRGGHLFEGTHRDNCKDAGRKGRLSYPKRRNPKVTKEHVEVFRKLRAWGVMSNRYWASVFDIDQSYMSLLINGKRRPLTSGSPP